MTLRHNFADGFVIFGIFVQPLLMALLAFWMMRDHGSAGVIYIVIGSGMTGLWTAALFLGGTSITGERWYGTLESVVAAPASLQTVIFGKNLAAIVQSLGAMAVSYLLAGLIFGNLPAMARPGWFILVLALSITSYVISGLLLGALFILNPEILRFQNGLEFPIYILAGFLFPIALLPGWTTPLSYVLAPYWAARALHGASSGATDSEIILALAVMVGVTLIYLLLAQFLLRRVMHRARVEASLGRQ
jgi:ABC-2 type transport system permease protein